MASLAASIDEHWSWPGADEWTQLTSGLAASLVKQLPDEMAVATGDWLIQAGLMFNEEEEHLAAIAGSSSTEWAWMETFTWVLVAVSVAVGVATAVVAVVVGVVVWQQPANERSLVVALMDVLTRASAWWGALLTRARSRTLPRRLSKPKRDRSKPVAIHVESPIGAPVGEAAVTKQLPSRKEYFTTRCRDFFGLAGNEYNDIWAEAIAPPWAGSGGSTLALYGGSVLRMYVLRVLHETNPSDSYDTVNNALSRYTSNKAVASTNRHFSFDDFLGGRPTLCSKSTSNRHIATLVEALLGATHRRRGHEHTLRVVRELMSLIAQNQTNYRY